jgi:peptide subunit release factor RF-3
MALENERGISVTSSVMTFPYECKIIDLLDALGTWRCPRPLTAC